MRTLHQLTHGQDAQSPAEYQAKYYAEMAARAAELETSGVAAWSAVELYFERRIAELNDLATQPAEEQRDFYAGGERALRDLWQELSDLKTGAWKKWPDFKRRKGEEEADSDE